MSTHDLLPLLVCLLLLVGVWLSQYSKNFRRPSRAQEPPCSHVPRCLKPRSPLDCPACCLAAMTAVVQKPSPVSVRPWREVKSRRGVPKRVNTEGVACPNHACPYH